jgi:hypothetical protein
MTEHNNTKPKKVTKKSLPFRFSTNSTEFSTKNVKHR